MPSLRIQTTITTLMNQYDSQTPAQRQRILHTVFDGYNASSDFPGFPIIDDLLDMYPHCKVILNKRSSSQTWEKSVRASLKFFSTRWYHLLTYWSLQSYWHYKLYRGYMHLAKQQLGVDDIFSAECYERHNEWVRAVAAARGREVLEWQPEDGWEPLCRFLGRKVPDVPFPKLNESAEIQELTKFLVKRGLWLWTRVLVAVAVLVIGVTIVLYRWRI